MINFFGSVIPGAVTPMDEDGAINFADFEKHIDWLVTQGPSAIAVNVDISEGPHLSPTEKLDLLRVASRVVDGRCGVIAGVTSAATLAASREAEDASSAGAAALQVFPVGAYRDSPVPPSMVCAHFQALIKSSALPCVVFHMAERYGGSRFDDIVLAELCQIDGIAAVKESSWDLNEFRRVSAAVRAANDRVAVLSGNDRFLPECLANGADGVLAGFATVALAEHIAMVAAARTADFNTLFGIGGRLRPLGEALFGDPLRDVRSRTKVILEAMELIASATVRLPLLPISSAERQRLLETFHRATPEIAGDR